MVRVLEGQPVAREIEPRLTEAVADLVAADQKPHVATVIMSDDPADRTFVEKKRTAFGRLGIESTSVDIGVDEPASSVYAAIERVSEDPSVTAVFVQVPLPDHVSVNAVETRINPEKDVDCFHPETFGRLVRGEPRFVPATTRAVEVLLDAYDVSIAGADVVVVGRSRAVGRPLANRLLSRDDGNATVTICHSKTRELAEKTRSADVLVTAAGEPKLIHGDMVSDGAVVVDVSANRVPTEDGVSYVGDVDFDSVSERAGAITPVPGGVGPLTLTMLLENILIATRNQRA